MDVRGFLQHEGVRREAVKRIGRNSSKCSQSRTGYDVRNYIWGDGERSGCDPHFTPMPAISDQKKSLRLEVFAAESMSASPAGYPITLISRVRATLVLHNFMSLREINTTRKIELNKEKHMLGIEKCASPGSRRGPK